MQFLIRKNFLLVILILFLLIFIGCGSVPIITNGKVLKSGKTNSNLYVTVGVQIYEKAGRPWIPYYLDGGARWRIGLFDWIEIGGGLNLIAPGIGVDTKIALLKLEQDHIAIDFNVKATLSYFDYGGCLLYTRDLSDTTALNFSAGFIRTIGGFDFDGFAIRPDKADFIFFTIYYSWFNSTNNASPGIGIVLIKEVTKYQSCYLMPFVVVCNF